jgi:hypothetical protein
VMYEKNPSIITKIKGQRLKWAVEPPPRAVAGARRARRRRCRSFRGRSAGR